MDQLRKIYEIKNSLVYSSYDDQIAGFNYGGNNLFNTDVQTGQRYAVSSINTESQRYSTFLQRFDAPPFQKAMKVNKLILKGTVSIGKVPPRRVSGRANPEIQLGETEVIENPFVSVPVLIQVIKVSQYEQLDAFYGTRLNQASMTYGMPDSVIGLSMGHVDKFAGYNNKYNFHIEVEPNITVTQNDYISVFLQFCPPLTTSPKEAPEIQMVASMTYFGQ